MKDFKHLMNLAIIGSALVMGTASADQQILDDLIVDGSACIGFDCVNGESFGFDTLRLKENNLRIHFQDTSTSASFPTADWRIVANDTSNGGAEYLAFEDSDLGRQTFKVFHGARSNALVVKDNKIGLGTLTPVVELEIVDGDTPTVRLKQDGSSGFTPQTWDIAGNETNYFIRDVTNGSKLPFRIRPGAPTSSIDIAASGNVGINTSTSGASLHVRHSGSSVSAGIFADLADLIIQDNASTGDIGMLSLISGATGNSQVTMGTSAEPFGAQMIHNDAADQIKFNVNSANVFNINADGSLNSSTGAGLTAAGVWLDASSRFLKDNIEAVSLETALDTVMALDPVSFNYLRAPTENYLGFIAEDVPDPVASSSRKQLSPMGIVAVLTKVVQQQQQTIAELKARVEEALDK